MRHPINRVPVCLSLGVHSKRGPGWPRVSLFVYDYQIMIDSGRARLLMVVPVLCAFSLGAQTHFTLVGSETIQRRLDLYKGNDSTREAALLKLFAEAGCPTANLSEQPVPHRKQPNIVCVLPG